MSKPAPLCRYCGKPIAKRTETHYVRDPKGGSPRDAMTIPERIRSKAECQKLTNHTVVSVRYREDRDWHTDELKDRYVSWFNTWDGESYEDDFFCNGTCSRAFAYVMARAGQCTNAYVNALSGVKRKA